MAGRVRNFLERDGRFYARLVIPKELRPHLNGKTELRTPLGADRRTALQHHPREVGFLQDRLDEARQAHARQTGTKAASGNRARSPLPLDQLARRHYRDRLALDDLFRNDPRYSMGYIDDDLVAGLRRAIIGSASDDELREIVGAAFERFKRQGETDADVGTLDGRATMRALAAAEYEALSRVAERDDGDFTGEPTHPLLLGDDPEPEPEPAPAVPPVSLKGLLEGYLRELGSSGKGAEARRRWTPVFRQLVEFLKHDDANLLTKRRVVEWKDDLLSRYAPKTVRDSHIGSLKAVLTWAHDNERVTLNAAHGVKVRLTAKPQGREKGFTEVEARALLAAVRAYEPKHSDNPQTRESREMSDAKRWAPWLCAHTGARIAEITQLRREDVREVDGIAFIRITPDAGTVKTGLYRDVPIHRQLVALGFLDFVEGAKSGPLFYREVKRSSTRHPSKYVAQRLAMWLRTLEAMPADVDPSHGWRHRMKTIGRELRLDPRVIDAVQGHAARTAGENYGDVTLKARAAAMHCFPTIEVDCSIAIC